MLGSYKKVLFSSTKARKANGASNTNPPKIITMYTITFSLVLIFIILRGQILPTKNIELNVQTLLNYCPQASGNAFSTKDYLSIYTFVHWPVLQFLWERD